jgi:hypothetical protein
MVQTQEGAVRKGVQNDYGGYEFKRFYPDTAVPQKEYSANYKKWSDLYVSEFVKRSGR